MPSLEASLANLEKAKAFWRPPRPWRSAEESWQIRHLIWQWFTYGDPGKWSARSLERRLRVHHHYVQKLVREFTLFPEGMLREERESGFEMATFEQLEKACEITRQMRSRDCCDRRTGRRSG